MPLLPRASLLLAISLALGTAQAATGDITVLSGARIHTMDAAMPTAEAMAFDDKGFIVALGSDAELRKQYPDAKTLQGAGATVVPGLIDAHAHLDNLGLAMTQVDLIGTRSKQEIIDRLQAFEKNLKPGEWLLGRGWDQNDWTVQEYPGAADLDAAFPDRPVWIERVDGHASWANSAAMRGAKRDLGGTWQPDGGQVRRDKAGKPTGIFVDAAVAEISNLVPAIDDDMRDRALALAMQNAVEHGLTGVHNMGVSLAWMQSFQRLADKGAVPLRVYALADGDQPALEWLCKDGLYQHASGRLEMRAVKLYADGALGSRGAALLADYADDAGHRGLMVTDEAGLTRAAIKARDCGVQVATHAIGDRGNQVSLNVYEKVLGDKAASDHRWRIEHAQVIAPSDIPRFATLKTIASMQPTHATSDMPWAEQRVGAERIAGAYAWRQLLDAGARLALGSDFPVESVDPRLGLHAAVTRTDLEGKPPGGWRPQEKLTAYEALRGFTLDAAYAGFSEDEVGSLAVGKRADFVLLGADPLAPGVNLKSVEVFGTYVDGKPVYTKR